MLKTSKQSNESLHEVDVTTRAPMYRLVDRDLLRRLMQRTGTGASVSIRDLAEAAGVPHGTVGNLLTGMQTSVPGDKAHALAEHIGVDLLVLFEPIGRSTGEETAPLRAVSA